MSILGLGWRRTQRLMTFHSPIPKLVIVNACLIVARCRFRRHEGKIVIKETEIGHGKLSSFSSGGSGHDKPAWLNRAR